ncbi:MAG: hypothetical protein ACKOKG_10175, partial [Verrucomicrobiota bacterium]
VARAEIHVLRPGAGGDLGLLAGSRAPTQPGDVGRFFARCVEAPPEVRFLIVNGTSRPVRMTRLDLTVASTVLGYTPRDTWPEGL